MPVAFGCYELMSSSSKTADLTSLRVGSVRFSVPMARELDMGW